jgi:hypothetical protein
MKTRRKSPKSAPKHIEDRRLVVRTKTEPGEDQVIFEMDVAHPWNKSQIQSGEIRLFDPATDDRGPEVPFIATYGNRLSTWFPRTSGVYLIMFRTDTPDEVRKGWQLGFGSCTAPQNSRATIARVYADLVSRHPEWKPYLRVIKSPCVFHADSPLAPGGSQVDIDPATLPEPADESKLTQTFM